MNDFYQTIQKNSEAIFQRDKSVFKCFSFNVDNEEACKLKIKEFKQKFKEATHVCSAYSLYNGIFYYDDNGEPRGTAGPPIFNSLKRHNVQNVLVLVVRYYGGKKLGVRGLIEAYGEATDLVLEESGIKEVVIGEILELEVTYKDLDKVVYFLNSEGIEIQDKSFAEGVVLKVFIRQQKQEAFFSYLKDSKDIKCFKAGFML